jgi:4-amino-4-deoxy-L-arabinose transferase-like glycosyltransferase
MKQVLQFFQQKWFPLSFILILFLALFTRFYQVTSSPPSLYWEEMALGYDAYSVLKTGKDHLGNLPSIVAFESYGDYKPALYFYLLLPSLAVFGLNEFAVRLPTVLAGVGIVIGVGLIARLLSDYSGNKKNRGQLLQCLGMVVTTLSPWAILFSRAAWEVNVATCFIVYGVVCFLWSAQHLHHQKMFIGLGLLNFGLAMYTYHAARFIAPMLALYLFIFVFINRLHVPSSVRKQKWQLFFEKQKLNILKYFLLGCGFLIFLSPLLLSLRDNTVQQRLAETSIFADGHIARESNAAREQDNYSLFSRVFSHRYVFLFREFAENYLKHFNFQFLFVTGDENLRHSVQYFGQLYLFEVIFVLAGLGYVFRQKKPLFWFLLFWLLIGVIPAALTAAAPHALRTLAIMPVYMLLISFGIFEVVNVSHQKLQFLGWGGKAAPIVFILGLYVTFFCSFWHFYLAVYPKQYSGAWQYGYRQVVEEINRRKDQYSDVSITREMDRPSMAYWFFSKTDPHTVQLIDRQLQKDQGLAFQFEKIHFINFVNEAPPGLVASTLGAMNTLKEKGAQVGDITEINDPAGKAIWVVYTLH